MEAIVFIDCWTIQHLEVWNRFERTGLLVADGRRIPKAHRDPYVWMMWQMYDRLSEFEGRYPIWTWIEARPDLRQKGHLPPGEPGVLIEASVSEELVLQSDFIAWHAVLNRHFLALTEEEQQRWDDEWSCRPDAADRILRSWEHIFDLDVIDRSPLWGPSEYVQGAVECLEDSEIIQVKHFRAR